MKLLAIDSSSLSASCAIMDNGSLVGEYFLHTRMTHSQTLMPMAQELLHRTETAIESIDGFALSAGPGSFTGLRIGISAIKGLAFGLDKPCLPVSTLEALAWNLQGFEGIACAVMDARCNQVYTAMFTVSGGNVSRLTEDMALSLDDLVKNIKNQNSPVFLVGDGANLCYNHLDQAGQVRLAPATLLFQRASSVCACAHRQLLQGTQMQPADKLSPVYLRLPQAERELLRKQALNESTTTAN